MARAKASGVAAPPTKTDFDERMAVHTALSEQIWREQNLVSVRMTWNLTFQGMLVAIYVFAGSQLEGRTSSIVQAILGLSGLAVGWAVFRGVAAAQDQSGRLKAHWVNEFGREGMTVDNCDIKDGPFPQPFSPKGLSQQGRGASRGICYILIGLWVVLTLLAVATFFLAPEHKRVDCTIAMDAQGRLVAECPGASPPPSGAAPNDKTKDRPEQDVVAPPSEAAADDKPTPPSDKTAQDAPADKRG